MINVHTECVICGWGDFVLICILLILLAGILSYLLGSINFAIILSKLFVKKDVRDYGSGNAGMTNVVRTAGKLPGILTLLGDICKGAAAVSVGRYLLFPYLYERFEHLWLLPIYGAFFCGLSCMLGHIFPAFFGFRGGKGVATAVGVWLILDWRVLLIALALFLAVFLITKIVSAGSLLAAASLPVSTFFLYPLGGLTGQQASRWTVTLLALLFALLIIVKHRANIVRLCKGEEKPLTSKK